MGNNSTTVQEFRHRSRGSSFLIESRNGSVDLIQDHIRSTSRLSNDELPSNYRADSQDNPDYNPGLMFDRKSPKFGHAQNSPLDRFDQNQREIYPVLGHQDSGFQETILPNGHFDPDLQQPPLAAWSINGLQANHKTFGRGMVNQTANVMIHEQNSEQRGHRPIGNGRKPNDRMGAKESIHENYEHENNVHEDNFDAARTAIETINEMDTLLIAANSNHRKKTTTTVGHRTRFQDRNNPLANVSFKWRCHFLSTFHTSHHSVFSQLG